MNESLLTTSVLNNSLKFIEKSQLLAAHTSDPDDAFAWWAIANKRIDTSGMGISVETAHIQDINKACLTENFDIAAISSAAWPFLHTNYAILSPGASVGRGYGPALAVKSSSVSTLAMPSLHTVAIPGELTTGALLLRLFYPNVKTVEMRFDEIAQSVLRGDVDGGVLIHEELLNWQDKGLKRLACLGEIWQQHTKLPIPVGLNVVHRRMGNKMMERVAGIINASMKMAWKYPDEASEWALGYSIQTHDGIGSEFIEMFANDDTLALAPDCIEALNLLYRMAFESSLIPCCPALDIIEPINGVN